jgi:glycosyltransferase involved in cell wall biosynthesis
MPRAALFLGFDARIPGGLRSMGACMVDALQTLGFEVTGFMPALGEDRRRWGAFDAGEALGVPWVASGQPVRLPNFAAPVASSLQLRRSLGGFEVVHTVVGGGAWALPAFGIPRSVCWIATPYEEEARSRFSAEGLVRRAAVEALVVAENAVEGAALKAQGAVIALSEKTRTILAARHAISLDDMDRLYAPIDTETFFPGPTPDGDVCVMTARLDDERKDVEALMRAWPRVVERRPGARLVLVGEALPGGRARRAVDASGAGDSVELTGTLGPSEVAQRLREASLFVLSSRQEGLGIVALEAMACGAPVVTFSNGGTDELVQRSGAGAVIAERDPAAFAEAIVALLEDRARWRRERAAAIEFVKDEASPEVFAAGLARVHARLGIG